VVRRSVVRGGVVEDAVVGLSVDFGTSNTAAAWRDGAGRVAELRLSATGSLMPSAVLYQRGKVLVGHTAVQAALTDPDAFESSPKRRLADREIFLDQTMVAVGELVAAVFAEVLTRAGQVMGATPAEVVLTHPDQWAQPLQQLLVEAACAGGVDGKRVRLVSESQAAAWYYARNAPQWVVGSRLVVFDFGAGTCDVAALDKQPDGSFAVIAAEGLEGLGGKDLDARILAWVRRQLGSVDPVLLAELSDPGAVATQLGVHDRIRDAKEALSEASSAAIVLAGHDGNHVLQLTRDEFEGLIGADIDRAVELTTRVITAAERRHPAAQTPTIYLTGGSSSIPLVATKLAALGRIGVLGDPKTVVVQGALYAPTPAAVTAPAPAAHRRLGRPHLPATLRQRWSGDGSRRTVRRAITATAVGAALIAVVFGALYLHDHKPSRHTTTPPTPALPLIAGTQLDALLLDNSDVATIMGVTVSGAQTPGPIQHGLATVSGPEPPCQSITRIADPSLYPGGPPASWNGWYASSPQVGFLDVLEQAAVSMPSSDAALAVVQNAATTWKSCSGQLITVPGSNPPGQFSIGNNVGGAPPKIWLLTTQLPANGWTCQRALSAVSNLVIDTDACGYNITNQAVRAANVIAAKATQ
jgi:hypothetical protein